MRHISRSFARRGHVASRPATLHIGVDGAMLTTGKAEEYLIADQLVEILP